MNKLNVSSEWYTLETDGDVLTFIDGVHENEQKEYRSESFWLLLDDVGGRNMPIIPKQTFLLKLNKITTYYMLLLTMNLLCRREEAIHSILTISTTDSKYLDRVYYKQT
ncbi:1955_t:CDS:2 [Dentiscutata erythropus]|uniref:1955_t:CDS:1 n=1 Tax=Dentiscutata erythropus TaxID=1348616 RepID=A0A9N8ZMJ0_9GLOM|nr:1955_t:CDS:2 [Dentiscutata erythropus]